MGLRHITIAGGRPLYGQIKIQGSKNAVLPVLTSCILGEGICRIENCPRISDVEVTLRLLESVGCRVIRRENMVAVDASQITCCRIPEREASCIRSSILFLGALTGRCRTASLPFPGGCAIGARPVDLHVASFEKLGVRFEGNRRIEADGRELCGAKVTLPFPSVGATENIILASVLAPGETLIQNAAREPEIDELCGFLNLRGAKTTRRKDGSIRIEGVRKLRPVSYSMKPDRIVAGTYLLAAAAAGGRIRLQGVSLSGLESLAAVLQRIGVQIREGNGSCELASDGRIQALPYLETAPYPGFPTDLQSPLLAVLAGAAGESLIREKIFENRFRVVPELVKMGAEIKTEKDCVKIYGNRHMHGADVMATDLRSGAALVAAGLAAPGTTKVGGLAYIERGYENICRDLRQLGADISLSDGSRKENPRKA